jgi:hypothetical protein
LKSSVNRLCLFPAIAVSSRDYRNGSPLFQGKSKDVQGGEKRRRAVALVIVGDGSGATFL